MRLWTSVPGCRPCGRGVVHGPSLAAILLLSACDIPTDLPRFESTFVVPAERITVPVMGQPVTVTVTHDLADARDLASRARGGALVVDVENPGGATGRIDLRISNSHVDVTGTIDAAGGNRQRIPLTPGEVQALLGQMVTFRATATLCPAGGCTAVVPPGGTVTLRARFELMLMIGTEG